MAAISSNVISFYPHPEPEKISTQDICSICLENLKPYFENNLKTKYIWNHRTILVHKNDKASKGYSCLMHGDCIKNWLRIKHICSSCRSTIKYNYDSTFTLREKAQIALLDGIDGALVGIKFSATFLSIIFTSCVGGVIDGHMTCGQIPSMVHGVVTNRDMQMLTLGFVTLGTISQIAVSHIKRKKWFFRQMSWPHGYDRSLFRVITRN